jgi:TrmH family RNA methyltransferase
MAVKKIESLQHPLVKHLSALRTDRQVREEAGHVLVFGEKMCRELPIDTLLTLHRSDIPAKEKYLVTEPILKKISGLAQPDGFAALVKMPKPQNLAGKSYLLILDGISDPGNLGTLLRTALALGWEGVILTPDTVDLFNDKAIRAAKGATFHLPYARMDREELIDLKFHFYTADLEGEALDAANFTPPMALILSNEARGPSPWAKKYQRVTIPMNPAVESMNVAVSGAILLYAMRPK